MEPNLIYQIIVAVLIAAATYGAIRQDIKNIHEKISEHRKDIDKAHERIDDILMGRQGEHARR